MSDYTHKVKQYRAGLVYDERYRLQPEDFGYDWQSYWEWRAGEPDFDAIQATEEAGIAEVEAQFHKEQL